MTSIPKRDDPRNWVTAFTFGTLMIIFMVINYEMVSPYLLSILMGGIIALLFYPYYKKLLAFKFRPMWAAAVITLATVLVIVLPLIFFTINVASQGKDFAQKLYDNEEFSIDHVIEKISDYKFVKPFVKDPEEFKSQLVETGKKAIEVTSAGALAVVGSIPDRLLLITLAMLSFFFFLVDGQAFIHFINNKIPLDLDVRKKLYDSFKNTAISVIWASIAAATAQSVIVFIIFLILGIPNGLLASGATFIFAWVPLIGAMPVWIAGIIYLYTQDRDTAIIVLVIIGLFTSLLDNYVRSWVLKGRNELHPLIGLVSIFGGINMFGILGVFVGPVFAATLISLIQIWPTVGKRFGLTFRAED